MRKTHDILVETRAALPALTASKERKNAALEAIACRLLSEQEDILAANRADVEASKDKYGEVMIDRLTLTPERIAGMAQEAASQRAAQACIASTVPLMHGKAFPSHCKKRFMSKNICLS